MIIEAKPGKGDKIHISVDGEYRFTVDSDFWYSGKFYRETELADKALIDEFYLSIGSRHAFLQGLRLLSYSDKSKRELKFKLRQKGNRDEWIDNAIALLENLGYINEKRYARNVSEGLIEKKHLSKYALTMELKMKGIPDKIINEVLGELEFDSGADIALLLDTKYSRYLGDEKGIRKTIAALQRLGYGFGEIKRELEKRIKELEDEEAAF